MYQYPQKKNIIFLYVTLIPYLLTAQLYNNNNFTELSSHFFGLGYYHTAWQSSIFEEDIYEDLQPINVVKSRNSKGGTGFEQVELQLNEWKKKLLI